MAGPLRIGLPKGRVLDQLRPLFAAAGIDLSVLDKDDRRLVFGAQVPEVGAVEILLLRPADVAVYVENGVCALGIAGSDTLLEQRPDVLAPLDLGIGRCRLVVAGKKDVDPLQLESPTIATKYPRLAADWFVARGVPARVIALSGSVEIAPLVGLADAIVDIVETGATLAHNGLVEQHLIEEVSSRLVVNRAALKLRTGELRAIETRLRAVV